MELDGPDEDSLVGAGTLEHVFDPLRVAVGAAGRYANACTGTQMQTRAELSRAAVDLAEAFEGVARAEGPRLAGLWGDAGTVQRILARPLADLGDRVDSELVAPLDDFVTYECAAPQEEFDARKLLALGPCFSALMGAQRTCFADGLRQLERLQQYSEALDGMVAQGVAAQSADECRGWLSIAAGVVVRVWRKRWFVLASGRLLCYERNAPTFPRGEWPVGGARVRYCPDSPLLLEILLPLVGSPSESHAVAVGGPLRLLAATEGERERWFAALQAAASGLHSQASRAAHEGGDRSPEAAVISAVVIPRLTASMARMQVPSSMDTPLSSRGWGPSPSQPQATQLTEEELRMLSRPGRRTAEDAGASGLVRAEAQPAAFLHAACPGNDACAECGAPLPEWVSLAVGQLVCAACAAAHRAVGGEPGARPLPVRSLVLDTVSRAQLWMLAQLGGNRAGNALWERFRDTGGGEAGARGEQLPRPKAERASSVERETWVRAKYVRRAMLRAPAALPLRPAASGMQLVAACVLAGGPLATVRELLAQGAPVDFILPAGAEEVKPERVQERGSVDLLEWPQTPLAAAASVRNLATVLVLLELGGASAQLPDRAGNTALHHAAAAADPVVCAALLQAGAAKDAHNDRGQSPVDLALLLGARGAAVRAVLEAGSSARIALPPLLFAPLPTPPAVLRPPTLPPRSPKPTAGSAHSRGGTSLQFGKVGEQGSAAATVEAVEAVEAARPPPENPFL